MLPSPFFDSEEDYIVASYRELEKLIDTHMEYVRGDLGEIKGHLQKLNSHLEDHSKRITTVEVLQKERNRPSKKSIAGYVSGAVAILVALWKSFMA